MGNEYISHKTSYVWLITSYGGVQGFELDEINYYIDSYNKSSFRDCLDFWEWLYACYGFNVRGFSILCNEGNPLMSKVHSIKAD